MMQFFFLKAGLHMGDEIPASLHLRKKLHVHEKITCVCKQAKNH